MKKLTSLAIIIGISFSINAQNRVLWGKMKPNFSEEFYMLDKNKIHYFTGEEMIIPSSRSNTYKTKAITNSALNSVEIGETNYDLQTNASVARRIINYGDGTLTAVWTVGTNASAMPVPSPDRGTGYNYFDGTTWFSSVASRLESTRTGWPNIGLLKAGNEIIITHDGVAYNFQKGTNATKGSDATWTFAKSNAGYNSSITKEGTIWGRIAIGGSDKNTVHLISCYRDTALPKINGVKTPIIYSRSLDGGATWDINGITLPGYDSTRTLSGAGDEYTIDAADTNLAIVIVGIGDDVTLWKSANNGTSFKKLLVDSFPYAPNYGRLAPSKDTIPTNDGSVTVMLDKNGKAHVAYAYSEVWRTGLDTGFFAPWSMALMYWNEITHTLISIPIPMKDIDADNDGKYTVGNKTMQVDKKGARYGGGRSLLCMPSMAMDSMGNIFIVFSLPADGDSTTDGQNYRDIWVVASQDSGKTWGKVQNMTKTTGIEEAFGSVAKLADDYVHIVYQEDDEPGTLLTNGDDERINSIRYMKVKTADILSGIVGVEKLHPINDLFSVSQNYPNPFDKQTSFNINLKKSSSVEVGVWNVLGQKVMNTNAGNLSSGTHSITVDGSKLNKGFYFYTVKAGDYSITKKMIIQ